MRKLLVPIGYNEQMKNMQSLDCARKCDMERLLAFYDFMGKGGVGQFVQRSIVEKATIALVMK
jgi:hypothetical protein